jgi:hypothetical protein
MKTSDSINELAEALSKAQAVMQAALKDSNNPAFNSKYADLSAVWAVARQPLTDNGLCIIQMPTHSEDGKLHLTTRLAHKSGQWVEDTMSIPVAKDNAHGYGSAITYCKRFGMSAAVGIISDVDDDGNEAVKGKSPADKVLARKSDARTFTIEALEALGPEEQAFLQAEAIKVIDAHENGGAAEYVRSLKLDSEEKMALWSLLPSNVRAAIKKAPSPTELASQP